MAEQSEAKLAYVIRRAESGHPVTCTWDDGSGVEELVPHIPVHSPTGFETGYAGSGPADLALAICAHYLGVRPREAMEGNIEPAQQAWMAHQAAKETLLVSLHLGPGESHRIPVLAVAHVIGPFLRNSLSA